MTPYRAALALALVSTALLLWLAAGVGVIGADGDPANALYLAVPAVGLAGAAAARLKPRGMASAMAACALAQGGIGAYAIAAGLGRPHSGAPELLLLNGLFVAAFAASAMLFRRSAQKPMKPPPR